MCKAPWAIMCPQIFPFVCKFYIKVTRPIAPWMKDNKILNVYRIQFASNLTSKENQQCDYQSILEKLPKEKRENEFCINHTTYQEVEKIIKGLKNDCSSGFDNIPIRFIKPVSQYIISPIVDLINTSVDRKIFPKQWKTARVCPIPKIDHPSKLKDYRPISILPVLSKIYERVILFQLCEHIENNHLYNSTQSGFRKGHSTSTLLLKLRDDIRKAMKKSEITPSLSTSQKRSIPLIMAFCLISFTNLISLVILSKSLVATFAIVINMYK